MEQVTTPRVIEQPCSWCKGRGTGRTWGRPDLGDSYYDSESCAACNGTRVEITLLCPVVCLLGDPCDAELVMAPGGYQGDPYYVHFFSCGNGHSFAASRDFTGARTWTRLEDVAMQPVAVAS